MKLRKSSVELPKTFEVPLNDGAVLILRKPPVMLTADIVDSYNDIIDSNKDEANSKHARMQRWAWVGFWIGVLWAHPTCELECGAPDFDDDGELPSLDEMTVYGVKVLEELEFGLNDLNRCIGALLDSTGVGATDGKIKKARSFLAPIPAVTT